MLVIRYVCCNMLYYSNNVVTEESDKYLLKSVCNVTFWFYQEGEGLNFFSIKDNKDKTKSVFIKDSLSYFYRSKLPDNEQSIKVRVDFYL